MPLLDAHALGVSDSQKPNSSDIIVTNGQLSCNILAEKTSKRCDWDWNG